LIKLAKHRKGATDHGSLWNIQSDGQEVRDVQLLPRCAAVRHAGQQAVLCLCRRRNHALPSQSQTHRDSKQPETGGAFCQGRDALPCLRLQDFLTRYADALAAQNDRE